MLIGAAAAREQLRPIRSMAVKTASLFLFFSILRLSPFLNQTGFRF